ncbi:MAG: FCD domain-containing protein [Pseudohongiellaceae bacterium]
MTATTTISHEIAANLRDEILRQQYRSGERLPSERDLASRFAASRGAVREALSQLEQLGLITIQPGGARIKPIDAASIAILGPLLQLQEQPDGHLIDQFLQTFAALAALNAREALTVADDAQLKQMQTLLASLRKHSDEFESSQQHWVTFLEYLASVADILVVRLINNDLKTQFMTRMVKEDVKPALKKKAVQDVLQNLSRALDTRDREQFATAVLRYFDELRAAVNQYLDQRLAG